MFHRRTDSADGLSAKCKACDLARYTAFRLSDEGRARVNETNRAYRRRDPLKQASLAQTRRLQGTLTSEANYGWKQRNREKSVAHQKVHYALKTGRLIREPCETCGEPAEAHHDDYARPLDVRWLCKQHHTEHHNAERTKP